MKYISAIFLLLSIIQAQPDISVSPDSLNQHLYTNGDSTQVLTIANNGDADLIWSLDISEPSSSASRDSTVWEFTNCGQTGYSGPSQSQCDNEYSDDNSQNVRENLKASLHNVFGLVQGHKNWDQLL